MHVLMYSIWKDVSQYILIDVSSVYTKNKKNRMFFNQIEYIYSVLLVCLTATLQVLLFKELRKYFFRRSSTASP